MLINKLGKYILAVIVCAVASLSVSHAQFRKDAFTQSYNDPADTTGRDTTDVMFSFKEYFGGIKHKEDPRIGVLMAGSTVFVGGAQMYNKQYWKLPVIYGGIGAGVGGGIIYRQKYHKEGNEEFKQMSNWFFAGAGLVWWGSLMDGTINYRKEVKHQSGKATLYSILVPGLGQAYNGEYWKIPIYYSLMMGSAHYYYTNRKSYKRYQWIYREATKEDGSYSGAISASTAQYYRNIFRRYRDYSVVAFAASYLLQVIDANVFSYMRDFDLSDDIALNVSPTVITDSPVFDYNPYQAEFKPTGLHYAGMGTNGLGLRFGLTF